MQPFEYSFVRVTERRDEIELDIEIEEFQSHEPLVYLVPRSHPYTKKTIEATMELIIEHFNELVESGQLQDKDLLHVLQGLIGTADILTKPKFFPSWNNEIWSDEESLRYYTRIERTFDFDSPLRGVRSNVSRKPFPKSSIQCVEDKFIISYPEPKERYHMAILTPKLNGDKMLQLAYSIRMLGTMTTSLKAEKSYRNDNLDYQRGQTDNEIHEECIAFLKRVSSALNFLVNCSSWREKQLMPYDLMDLESKTGNIHR